MDFSKFKTPDWLLAGGGLVFLIGGFLDWISVEFEGFSNSGGNAFDFFLTGIVPWLLIVGAGVLTVLRLNGTLKPGGPPWTLIIALATVLGAVLVTLRFLFPALGEDVGDLDVGRGIGLILCWLAGLASATGGVMNFLSTGGTIKDLADPNKLRQAFDRPDNGGSTPPPPPPPGGGQMPPPPPPGA